MIEFPNHSRFYDRTRHAVRFWGHDSAIEASFFISEGATAAKAYVRGRRGSYDLVAANF